MRHRRLYARISAAIVIPMMALSIPVLGGALAASASTGQVAAADIQVSRIAEHGVSARQPRAAVLTWHKLALINAWTSSQGTYGTGDPAYAVSGEVVYLSGSIHGGANELFAVLPAAARPTRWLYLTVYTFAGTSGTLRIEPNGDMAAYSTPAASATDYTSLAAVSFPTARITRHKLTLINGWKSNQQTTGTGDPASSIIGAVVYLSGALRQPSGTSELFAVLPKAARPAHALYITVLTGGGNVGTLRITPDGRMFAYSVAVPVAAREATSLAAISYPHHS